MHSFSPQTCFIFIWIFNSACLTWLSHDGSDKACQEMWDLYYSEGLRSFKLLYVINNLGGIVIKELQSDASNESSLLHFLPFSFLRWSPPQSQLPSFLDRVRIIRRFCEPGLSKTLLQTAPCTCRSSSRRTSSMSSLQVSSENKVKDVGLGSPLNVWLLSGKQNCVTIMQVAHLLCSDVTTRCWCRTDSKRRRAESTVLLACHHAKT